MLQPKIKLYRKDDKNQLVVKEVPVPALSFDTMERLDQEKAFDQLPLTGRGYWGAEARKKAAAVLLAALRQEMPESEVTEEDARKALTAANVVPVVVLWLLCISEEDQQRAEADLAEKIRRADGAPPAPAPGSAPGEAPRP